jgi:hypothetical protein
MTEPRTRLRGRARHLAPVLTIPLLLAGTAASIGPAAASAAVPTAACSASSGPSAWGGPTPVSPGTEDNGFFGVTVLSPCDAWAVGFDQNIGGLDQTLIENWDGTAWTVVPSPNVAGLNNQLTAVRADSPTDIWAVGESFATGTEQTLILHWNGQKWAQVASPSPRLAYLNAVRAVSPTDAWAVGSFGNATFQSLILHWNGHTWAQVASPHPGTNAALYGVAATSASNAWAVGTFFNGTALQGFILHWNGQKWARQSIPNPGGPARDTRLNAIAAGAASGKAWAVGSYFDGTTDRTLILAWTGTKWVQQASPTPGDSFLSGAATTSSSNTWTVGEYDTGTARFSLILHWNGTKWAQVASPSPSSFSMLFAVAATSATNAWAVGQFNDDNTGLDQNFAIHCCD